MKTSSAKDLVGLYYTKIVKSLRYLEYSFNRTLTMPTDPKLMNDSQLEAWDGFASRFARTSDIFLSKYLKARIEYDDPAYEGSFRDLLNRAEKLGIIDDVEIWREIRELRNATVHEYSDSDLQKIFEKFRLYSPRLIDLKIKLQP